MENEILQMILDTQRQILDKFDALETAVGSLDKGQDELRQGQDELRQGQDELRQGQDELRQAQDELRQGQDELRQGQDELRQVQDELRQGQIRIEIIIENEIRPQIKTLSEQHGTIIEKLNGLPEKVRELQNSDKVQNAAISELARRTANR